MPPKEITEWCQQAIDKASVPDVKLQGINKPVNGIRVRYTTEEQIGQLRAIEWNGAFEEIKICEPNYGIVINAMPRDKLDPDDLKTKVHGNDFLRGTISKIIFLQRKD